MPQWHVRKHPLLKQLSMTNQMKPLFAHGAFETSVGRAKKLFPVVEKMLASLVRDDELVAEATRVRFFVSALFQDILEPILIKYAVFRMLILFVVDYLGRIFRIINEATASPIS
jgi:ribosomal protein L17